MAVTPRIDWVAIYDDFEADSGVPVSLTPGNVINDLTAVVHTQEVNGDDRIKLVLPRSSASWNSGGLKERRVLRLELDDGTVEEYRIASLKEIRQPKGKLQGVIEAEGAIFELTGPKKIQRTESSGLVQPDFTILNLTPTELINTYILPFAPSYFALGTIDPTDEVPEFTFDFWSPLEALRQLADLTNTELEITRPSGSAYNINLLTTVGAGSVKPLITLGKNLVSFEKHTDTRETANRIYGKGAGEPGNRLTLGTNLWEVTSNSPLILAGAPVWEDDVLNNLYMGKEDRSDLTQISDCTNPGTFVVGNPTPFTVGSRVRIYQASTPIASVSYLEDVASVTARGPMPASLEASDLGVADNFCPNSKLDGFVVDNPDNWDAVNGAVLTANTDADFTRIGGKSLKVVAAASGEGVDCDVVTIAPPDDNPYYSSLISLWVVSGAVRVELVHSTEGTFPPPEKKAWTQATDQWVDLTIEGLLLPAGTLKLNVVADGGAATWYLDGALMTNFSSSPVFVAEHTANELWRRSANELVRRRTPDVSYTIKLIDVNAIDPDSYPLDKLVLGGDARVNDPSLATDIDLRVISWERDRLHGHATKTTLASRVKGLTDEELDRKLRGLDRQVDNTSANFLWLDHRLDVDGDIIIKYRLNELGKSIRYSSSNSSQPTRATVLSSGTIQDSVAEDALQVGTALAPNLGDVAYVTIVAFTGTSATGRDCALIELRLTQFGDTNEIVSAYLTSIPFTDVGGGNPGINTFIRPDGDLNTSDWTAGTGVPLWEELNDNDVSDYAQSADSTLTTCPTKDTYDFEVTLTTPSGTPKDSQTQEMFIRTHVQGTDFGAPEIDLTMELRQGATLIATLTAPSLTSGFATKTYQLSNAEVDAITDHTDLRVFLQVTICDDNPITPEFAQCAWIECEYVAKTPPPRPVTKSTLYTS